MQSQSVRMHKGNTARRNKRSLLTDMRIPNVASAPPAPKMRLAYRGRRVRGESPVFIASTADPDVTLC